MPDFLDDIARLDEAEEQDRAELLRELLCRAEVSYGANDPTELHLVRGYAAYHFPESLRGTIDVEQELRAVLSNRPGDVTARFYLACHSFDVGEFQNALEHFSLLDTSRYVELGQVWRGLKVEELKLCCELQLERYHAFLPALSRLIERAVATTADNVAPPTELVSCFETCGKRLCEVVGIESYEQGLSLLQTYITHSGTNAAFRDRMVHLRKSV